MTLDGLCVAQGLFVMGETEEIVLIGAASGMWPVFTASPEYKDGAPDPLDRWSKRVIGAMAAACGGTTVFPSDGPPYPPFIAWAKATGRFWSSPTGMLVHDIAGLMISIRGAIVIPDRRGTPGNAPSPCATCSAPCTHSCPVGALSLDLPYDVPACKAFLDTVPGQDCMDMGCKARRACPISQIFTRDPAQSAFHMAAFK